MGRGDQRRPGRAHRRSRGHGEGARPNTRRGLAASGGSDGAVGVWDLSTGEEVLTPFLGHGDTVSAVAFLDDGSAVVSGSENGTIIIWGDTRIAEPLTVGRVVRSTAADAVGARLAMGGDGFIDTYDVASRTFLPAIEWVLDGFPEPLALSADGCLVAAGYGQGSFGLWEVQSQRQLGTLIAEQDLEAALLALAAVGLTATEGDSQFANLQGLRLLFQRLSFAPDGSRLAGFNFSSIVWLWGLGTLREVARLEGHSGFVTTAAFSPDGRLLATGDFVGGIRLWDGEAASLLVL